MEKDPMIFSDLRQMPEKLLWCSIKVRAFHQNDSCLTLWCQLEDTFQLIVTPQGMELVMVHIEVISQCLKKYRVEYKACYIFLLDTIQL